MEEKHTQDIWNVIIKNNLFYLAIGELISADTNMSKDEIENHLQKMRNLESCVDNNEIELTDEQTKMVKDGINILERDLASIN